MHAPCNIHKEYHLTETNAMNTNTELPLGPKADSTKIAEPAMLDPVKSPGKPETAKRRSGSTTIDIKASPINTAWSAEVVKVYGITGPLGDAVATELTKSVAAQLAKATSREKLTKLIRAAINSNVGKVGLE